MIASGLYHGVNPAMGWPLAVSAGLMGRGRRDLAVALSFLAAGHLAAMLAVLLPFGALAALADWQATIRIAAGLAVIATGLWLLLGKRHPRFLARIKPSRVALWSFAIALVHGAALMLVPVYLGLCRGEASAEGAKAGATLAAGNVAIAVEVALVHTLAMILAGGAIALLVYGWLGVQFIARSWFNLDAVWAASLILVGAVGILTAHG